jgi:hypothetical protein
MAIHVVFTRPMQVLNGQVIDKNNATNAEVMKADMDMRVMPDTDSPNSADSPSIKDYLVAEDTAGFIIVHMDNTMIVTQL